MIRSVKTRAFATDMSLGFWMNALNTIPTCPRLKT